MPEHQIWLLLVGINFYLDENVRLRGAVNDVSRMHLSLKRFYKDINVTKLLASVTGESGQTTPPEDKNLWPTWDNFTGKIKEITGKASLGDIIWIHYSGHGTLQPTENTEFTYQEGHGTDAALVLWEPNSSHGVRYLRGIELAIMLDQMVNKGLKVTLVLDSCHSGGISRKDANVRGIPWNVDAALEFPLDGSLLSQYLILKEKNFRDAAATSHWLLHPQGFTLLAACSPHERVKEIKVSEDFHGALSYLICKAFGYCAQNKIGNVTHDLIYRHVLANMFRIEQHPILIGSNKSTLRGVEARCTTARSTFEIIKGSAAQEICINAGLIHGVRIEDEYAVYVHAKAKDPITRLTIINVEDVQSIARYTFAKDSQAKDARVQVGYSVILTKLAQPRAHVRLLFEADDCWKEPLEKSIWLQCLISDNLASADILCFSVKPDDHQYSIHDTEGGVVPNLPPLFTSDPCVSKLTSITLEHLSKNEFVQALDNRHTNILTDSDFKITVQKQADPLDTYASQTSLTIPHDSKLNIKFHNLTNEVLYFTVLNLTPLWAINHLWPRHKKYQSVLPRNMDKVQSRLPNPIPLRNGDPSGVDCFEPRFKIPARLLEGQGSVTAKDVLKFIVSTHPIRGTDSLELPDIWFVKEHGVDRIENENFGGQIKANLMEKSLKPEPESGPLGGGNPAIRWACWSLVVHTFT